MGPPCGQDRPIASDVFVLRSSYAAVVDMRSRKIREGSPLISYAFVVLPHALSLGAARPIGKSQNRHTSVCRPRVPDEARSKHRYR
jgi:hypothetical protein